MRCHQRDHSVAEQPKAVSPGGHPISHSTNSGLKRGGEPWLPSEDGIPRTVERSGGKERENLAACSRSWNHLPGSAIRFADGSAVSVVRGVCQNLAAASRSSPPEPRVARDARASGPPVGVFGVGHIRAATANWNCTLMPCFAFVAFRTSHASGSVAFPPSCPSAAHGVGQSLRKNGWPERSPSEPQGVGHVPMDPEDEEPLPEMGRADLSR